MYVPLLVLLDAVSPCVSVLALVVVRYLLCINTSINWYGISMCVSVLNWCGTSVCVSTLLRYLSVCQ